MTAKILTLFAAVATFGTLRAIVQLGRQQTARIAVRIARHPHPALPEPEE